MTQSTLAEAVTENSVLLTRLLDAPRELVWQAWTEPQYLSAWWGAKSFTITTMEMNVRPGGVWRFAMHDAQGQNHPGKIVYLEVAPCERLIYSHGRDGDDEFTPFPVTVTFDEQAGQTRLTMRLFFDSGEERNDLREFWAGEGGASMLDCLQEHLSQMATSHSQTSNESSRNTMQVQPYLFFNGRCEEAAEFYRHTLDAQVTMMMRFSEMPPGEAAHVPPDLGHKIMHMSLQIGDITVMASDGMSDDQPKFEGFSLSLTTRDEAESKRLFDLLAEGGQIQMPLAPTFWSPCFGSVTDKFGVSWMVTVVS